MQLMHAINFLPRLNKEYICTWTYWPSAHSDVIQYWGNWKIKGRTVWHKKTILHLPQCSPFDNLICCLCDFVSPRLDLILYPYEETIRVVMLTIDKFHILNYVAASPIEQLVNYFTIHTLTQHRENYYCGRHCTKFEACNANDSYIRFLCIITEFVFLSPGLFGGFFSNIPRERIACA